MANLYILRAELTDCMSRLRHANKRIAELEGIVTKMECEIISLRENRDGSQATKDHNRRTGNDKGTA
jgi:hypothetical protein